MPQSVSIKPNRDSNIGRTIYQYLDLDGDGTGTKNANVDGSSVVQNFKIVVPDNQVYELARMIIHVRDSGVISPQTYGALAAMANGITIKTYDSGDNVVDALDGGVSIKANAEWGRVCYDVDIQDRGAGFEGYVNVRWTFEKAGQPLRLTEGQYLQVTIADNLTGLLEHYFQVQGRIV
jgi:hypothetical protein